MLPHPDLALLLGLGPEHRLRLAGLARDTLLARLALMTEWLDRLTASDSPRTPDQVLRAKPADAVDSCWNPSTMARLREPATFDGPGVCNALYPKTRSARMLAGAPLTDDVLKCRLRPVDWQDYGPAEFSASQRQRLLAVFREGVCDYTQPGIEQVPLKQTWLTY